MAELIPVKSQFKGRSIQQMTACIKVSVLMQMCIDHKFGVALAMDRKV